jgi:uncharacterized protein (DUF2252 family)
VGRAARLAVPRATHGEWRAAPDRLDPVAILEAQGASRVPQLLPVRYGRMVASPFAFYRGAAAVMAADLAGSPRTGFMVQACGDAHAGNFGIYGTPEREMIFDVNDFDETLPGPWEWDVKRLAASLAVAGRHGGFPTEPRREVVLAAVRSYRTAMRQFAAMGHLAVWYSRLDARVADQWRSRLSAKQVARAQSDAARARTKDSSRALAKLTVERDGQLRFASHPPLLMPLQELVDNYHVDASVIPAIDELLRRYADSLRPEMRNLLSNYHVVDAAHKVVGVGSVGTRAWIVLLQGRGRGDPLILQAKEAQASVLEPHLGTSAFANHGERVVVGQRLMQSASDIFLGWIRHEGIDGVARDFYVRQLWDWKGSIDLQTLIPSGLRLYGEICGWTLARAHARSGDAVAIGDYLGSGSQFDRALGRFAETYADQNELDHAALVGAVRQGRVATVGGV